MNSYLITYDLIGPNKDYEKLSDKIETYPNYERILESVWIVKSDKPSVEIRNDLKTTLDNDDKLFVGKLTGEGAWRNLQASSSWLKENL